MTEYSSDRKMKRYNYWASLRDAAKECQAKTGSTDKLSDYLLENYGLKMNLTPGEFITGEYDVIDESKYLIFLLKFK
jgi:hypothetical protein